MRLIFPIKAQR